MKVVLFDNYDGYEIPDSWSDELRTDPELIRLVESNPNGPIVKAISAGGKAKIIEIPDESTDFMVGFDEYDASPGDGAYRCNEYIHYVVDGKIYKKCR